MSNMQSAKAAILAELSSAKTGLTYYQSRVAALEKALTELENLDTFDTAASTTEKKGKKGGNAAVPVKAAKAAKKQGADEKSDARKLPSTGGDFWQNLVSEQPKSAGDVLQAALDSFGMELNKEQRKKIAQRMTFAINALVKAGKIRDSGSGRERRFFK